jgi:hypothetical protein
MRVPMQTPMHALVREAVSVQPVGQAALHAQTYRRPEPVSAQGRLIGWWLFATGLALYMLLSAQGLLALGIPYEAPWGPFIAKLHPGTWLIVLAYLTLLTSYGNPMRVAGSQMAAQPLLGIYLGCVAFIFVWSVARHGPSGAAFIIDTLITPALCAHVVLMLDSRQRHMCLAMIVAVLVANTLIGLAEGMLQHRLIPFRIASEAEIVEDFFRPTALMGHPLTNALITASLLPVAIYLRIGMAWRCLIMMLLWIGVLAFGGRTSFVVATLLYGGCFGIMVTGNILRGRFSYLQLLGGALATVFVATLAGLAIAVSGIGERVFRNLVWDNSASVRTRIWNVFDFVSAPDMLVGVSPSAIADLVWRLGLHGPGETIENFWLGMALQLGAIGFVPFAIAMGAAMWWLWKSSRGAMRLSVAVFFISASSNNSLSSKTVGLAMLFVAVALVRNRTVPSTSRPHGRRFNPAVNVSFQRSTFGTP